ncbi:hypothetical protein M3J09_012806 [Ascochyta lentis]
MGLGLFQLTTVSDLAGLRFPSLLSAASLASSAYVKDEHNIFFDRIQVSPHGAQAYSEVKDAFKEAMSALEHNDQKWKAVSKQYTITGKVHPSQKHQTFQRLFLRQPSTFWVVGTTAHKTRCVLSLVDRSCKSGL